MAPLPPTVDPQSVAEAVVVPPAAEPDHVFPTLEKVYELVEPPAESATPETPPERGELISNICIKIDVWRQETATAMEAYSRSIADKEKEAKEFLELMASLKKPLPKIADFDVEGDKTENMQKIAEALKFPEEHAANKEMRDKYLEWLYCQYVIGNLQNGYVGEPQREPIQASVQAKKNETKRIVDCLHTEAFVEDLAEKTDFNEEEFRSKINAVQGLDAKQAARESYLTEHSLPVPGSDGVRVALALAAPESEDQKPKKVFIVTKITPENVQRVIDAKRDQKQITCTGVPDKASKDLVKRTCLQNWKKVTIDGKESKLSQTMPEKPGDWSGWAKAIKQLPAPEALPVVDAEQMQKTVMRQMVQEVVGSEDLERLSEFWADVSKLDALTPEEFKLVHASLSEDQRSALEGKYASELEAYAAKETESITDDLQAEAAAVRLLKVADPEKLDSAKARLVGRFSEEQLERIGKDLKVQDLVSGIRAKEQSTLAIN